MDPVSKYERRVYGSFAALCFLAAASLPAWGLSRPARVWGLGLGIAASLVRLLWTFRLARRLARRFDAAGTTTWPARPGSMSGRRYAAMRALGYLPLAAALAVAGTSEGVDLYAAAFGVLFGSAASVAGSVLELRAVARQERAATGEAFR